MFRYIKLIFALLACSVILPSFAYGLNENKSESVKTVLSRNSEFQPRKYAKERNMAYVRVKDLFNDVVTPNTVYVINKTYDLSGKELVIPENCLLFFKNGLLKNGIVTGNNTTVVAKNRLVFYPGNPKYRGYKLKTGEFAYETNSNGAIQLGGSWNNEQCGDKWTGLLPNSSICASIALNNYIMLFKKEAPVTISRGVYQVYQTVNTNYHSVDFSGSLLALMRYDFVEDSNIQIPDGYNSTPLQHKGAIIKDVILQNTIGCGVAMNNSTTDITFDNVKWINIGEHAVYTHTLHGYVRFLKCVFRNCGQSEFIHKLRNGINACVKPSLVTENNLSLHSVRFEFEDCDFINEGTIPVLTCSGGGTHYKYTSCTWQGLMLGYSETSTLPDSLGHCIEHIFINCNNPVSRYSGYNTLRKLYSCTNVRNIFEDLAEAHNCDCVWSYSDVYNAYRNGLFPNDVVLLDSCRFYAEKDDYPRVVIHHPRPMQFDNCLFDFDIEDLQTSYNGYLILFKDRQLLVPVTFNKCQFKPTLEKLIDVSSLVIKMSDCSSGNSNLSLTKKEQLSSAPHTWRKLF